MSVFPATVTPFDASGKVDMAQMARLFAYFRASGCEGVVLAGTNGEGPSLSAIEKRDLVRASVPLALGLKVVLGIATPSLDETIWLAGQASKAGATAALVMAPSYFREASEEGIAQWFEKLMDATSLPVIAYNFPQRTGFELSPELLQRLALHPNMIGVKDSSRDPKNLPAFAHALPGKKLYVGGETLLLDALSCGWTGTISGAANVVPHWLVQVIADKDPESRHTKFEYLLPALEALNAGGQPMLNKELLVRLGVIDNPNPRLPLLPIPTEQVEQAMRALKGRVQFTSN